MWPSLKILHFRIYFTRIVEDVWVDNSSRGGPIFPTNVRCHLSAGEFAVHNLKYITDMILSISFVVLQWHWVRIIAQSKPYLCRIFEPHILRKIDDSLSVEVGTWVHISNKYKCRILRRNLRQIFKSGWQSMWYQRYILNPSNLQWPHWHTCSRTGTLKEWQSSYSQSGRYETTDSKVC